MLLIALIPFQTIYACCEFGVFWHIFLAQKLRSRNFFDKLHVCLQGQLFLPQDLTLKGILYWMLSIGWPLGPPGVYFVFCSVLFWFLDFACLYFELCFLYRLVSIGWPPAGARVTSCDPLQLPGVDRSTVTVDHDATNAALLGPRSVRYLITCYLFFLVIWPSIIAMLNTFFSCSQSVQYFNTFVTWLSISALLATCYLCLNLALHLTKWNLEPLSQSDWQTTAVFCDCDAILQSGAHLVIYLIKCNFIDNLPPSDAM